ncbi:MAG: hypothetical protein WB643_03265 [Candidatus Bathyarchaeia archaeon]
MNSRKICVAVFVVLLSICLVSISDANAVNAGPSDFNLAVSRIDTSSPVPYLEVRSLNFQGPSYGSTPFRWLWLSTSLDQQPWETESKPITEVIENKTVIIAQYFNHQETYPTENGAFSPHWVLVARNEYTYAFGFLVAFNDSITFDHTGVYASFYPPDIGDQWIHDEAVQRFDSPPNNDTLSYWGLRPADLVRYQRTYKTYYLYEFTFSKNSFFVQQLSLTYRWPAIGLLIVLIVSSVLQVIRKMSLGEALTLYLGTAFFTIPFLLSYSQLGLGGPISDTQKLLYADVYVAIFLALVAMLFRIAAKGGNKGRPASKPNTSSIWFAAILAASAIAIEVFSKKHRKKDGDTP